MRSKNWHQQLQWVVEHTPHTQRALERFPSRRDHRVAVRFHLDLKMVPVIEGLANKLNLMVFPCNQDTTDPDGFDYLSKLGTLKLKESWAPQDGLAHLQKEPAFLCDLGGEMISWALSEGVNLKACLEGTTSGLNLLSRTAKKHIVRFPILDWNNARLKRELHNEKMVGFSIWQTFSEVTRLSLHGKTVGVLGFGAVGRGICRTARALGARVLVYDPDPRTKLVADFEGFWSPDRSTVLKQSEVLVTATGAHNVLESADLATLPSGAILLNAGHSEKEWAEDLRALNGEQTLEHVRRVELPDGHSVYLLAEGRLLNLAAGFGDTINAFDITSAQLVEALRVTVEESANYPAGIHQLEDEFFTP